MPKGEPTDPEIRAKFRAHFLVTHNTARSARELKIPERTGQAWATDIRQEPEYALICRELRARHLEELVSMRQEMAQESFRRFMGKDDGIETITKGENTTVIDKRPDYGKLILDSEKNAHNLAKIEGPRDESEGNGVEVHIHLTPEEEPDGEEA